MQSLKPLNCRTRYPTTSGQTSVRVRPLLLVNRWGLIMNGGVRSSQFTREGKLVKETCSSVWGFIWHGLCARKYTQWNLLVYTCKNVQVITNLQQTCSNQDLFALLVPSSLTICCEVVELNRLVTSCSSNNLSSFCNPTTCQQDVFALLVDNLLQGCWPEQTCYK